MRSSGFNIHRKILDAVIADHFRFPDLFQPAAAASKNVLA
jgi:hypothetical protein